MSQEKPEDLTSRLLTDWLFAHGCSVSPSLRVQRTSYGGRGLFSVDGIRPQEKLITIKHIHLLNYTNTMAHILSWSNASYNAVRLPEHKETEDDTTRLYSRMDMDSLLTLTSFQMIAMYIVLEKKRGVESWWFPFLESLPPGTDFETSPLTWKLKGKSIKSFPKSTQRHTQKMHTRFITDYNVITAFLKRLGSAIPQDEFLWSWFCVNSRCLYMEIPESHTNEDNFTMAPFVDLINHSAQDHCLLQINHSGFHVLSSVRYDANMEVYLSYGPHSNEFLLCEYGFTLPENPWNDVDITDLILNLLDGEQRQFLESKGYLGEYTISYESISFRIEVALAVSLEKDGDVQSSRGVNALINGVSDGAFYKRRSNQILVRILGDLEVEYQERVGDGIEGKLYMEQLQIITHWLEELQE